VSARSFAGCAWLVLLGVLVSACARKPAAAPEPVPVAAALAARIAAADAPLREGLGRLYGAGGAAPLWLDGSRPNEHALAALAVVADARARGLDPEDYGARRLAAAERALAAAERASPQALARFEVELSAALLQLLADLHYGRASPDGVAYGLGVAHPARFELAALVAAARRERRIAELPAAVEPQLQAYRRLLGALARYRTLAADPSAAPVAIEPTVRPGDPLERADDLARWLGALGDLAAAAPPDASYTGALVAGVARFQRRHGLEPDGVIGPATARALGVPPAARVRQIELALERFRWIPDTSERRVVLVNVPAFELLAFDRIDPPGGPALALRVVAGRAGRTPTPVLAGLLRSVVFHPYWNVPRSITTEEMLPKLAADPAYLAAKQLEIVRGEDVLPGSAEDVAALAAGTARLRQRPGPENALGRVKFVFTNPHDVFLHDTPAQQAFLASRRDFSHGCVRVEDAVALARWVLGAQPEGEPERVEALLAAEGETAVAVREPPLVLLFYATAEVRADGSVAFYEDVYGHDAALARALARGAPPARRGEEGGPPT
jgi:murein L,D-transpeptidase YcbB/YkuD